MDVDFNSSGWKGSAAVDKNTEMHLEDFAKIDFSPNPYFIFD
jgi:hypothetical protein